MRATFFSTEKVDTFKNISCLLLPLSFVFLKKETVYVHCSYTTEVFNIYLYRLTCRMSKPYGAPIESGCRALALLL